MPPWLDSTLTIGTWEIHQASLAPHTLHTQSDVTDAADAEAVGAAVASSACRAFFRFAGGAATSSASLGKMSSKTSSSVATVAAAAAAAPFSFFAFRPPCCGFCAVGGWLLFGAISYAAFACRPVIWGRRDAPPSLKSHTGPGSVTERLSLSRMLRPQPQIAQGPWLRSENLHVPGEPPH